MKTKLLFPLIVTGMIACTNLSGQNSTYRSLLPEKIMDEIIGEASGETAMTHIIEMGAYNHNRPLEEYTANFFETDYIFKKLKEYGLEEARIFRYPGGSYWDGIRGELWEVSPGLSKLADYDDLTAMLAQGSRNTDINADLVWVGTGSAEELDRAGVKAKIVVTSSGARMVHDQAVSRGAVGVVSFDSPRPLVVSSAIPITGISGRGASGSETFGFFLPPREGHLLRDRLLSGEKIKVHAVVEAQTVNYEMQVPSCVIKGTDPNADEIIFSAHLFEGYVKQGANDNISGSAAILEVARMLKTMIDEGRIDRPERNIRFIWVPEFSGTGPWVNEHKELMQKTLCNINLDMVGINLANSKSFLCMHRTTYGNAHYLNDVMENYYEFVGLTNREGLAISGRGGFLKRIVAPSGSDDPFYFRIDDHYGASDHEVFNDPGVRVPGIMMITWPDLYYHTSQDRADKCDPTQMKRVCVIATAAAYTIASAGDDLAIKIGNEITGNASGRIGMQLTRATDLLDKADKNSFKELFVKGHRYIEAAVSNEKATLRSVAELGSPSLTEYITNQMKSVEVIGMATISSFVSYMNLKARSLGVDPVSNELTKEEVAAMKIVPVVTSKLTDAGYGASRSMRSEFASYSEKYPIKGRVDTSEILRLCNGSYNAFEIKILLDGQMTSGETSLEAVVNTIMTLSELGYVKI